MKITEKIFDIITNEETIVERDMTPEEVDAHNKAIADAAKAQAEAEAKAAARQALLDKLGITAEEAQLLLGGN